MRSFIILGLMACALALVACAETRPPMFPEQSISPLVDLTTGHNSIVWDNKGCQWSYNGSEIVRVVNTSTNQQVCR